MNHDKIIFNRHERLHLEKLQDKWEQEQDLIDTYFDNELEQESVELYLDDELSIEEIRGEQDD